MEKLDPNVTYVVTFTHTRQVSATLTGADIAASWAKIEDLDLSEDEIARFLRERAEAAGAALQSEAIDNLRVLGPSQGE